MIINKLVMCNFRVFRGEHILNLEPEKNQKKPLILIGGLNGAGKTSILTAIRLALYGAQAFDDVYTKQAYRERLISLIHNNNENENESVQDAGHAYVEITFTLQVDGEKICYRARRDWSRVGDDVLNLYENDRRIEGNKPDLLQSFLNELIPVGVGDLFFFDGEKISTLAEDNTGSILRIAMQRLLGLDVVSRLKNDLKAYVKNEEKRSLDKKIRFQVDKLEERKKELINIAERKRNQTVEFLNGIKANISSLRKHEALLTSLGNDYSNSKASEQARLKVLNTEQEHIEKQLRNALDGYFPISLAPNTFKELFKQIELEKKIIQAKTFREGLESFLNELQAELAIRSTTTLKIATETIQDKLNDYLELQPEGEVLLDVSERESNVLYYAFNSIALKQKKLKDILCAELKNNYNAISQVKNNISRVPEKEHLSETFKTIREYDKAINGAVDDFSKLNSESKAALHEALECIREQQKIHDMVRNNVTLEKASEHATSTLPLLDEYSDKLTNKRISEVESEFSKVYKRLARKDELKLTAKIDPVTFNVDLQNDKGQIIERNLLSAGEKQIYAITMLEALGKVSGKSLPVIIDTPLGRLDSQHRDKLVENYIPDASHQVILLSTDTEIDERYYFNFLKEFISKEYEICYLAEKQSSIIKNGYFFVSKSLVGESNATE